MERCDDSIQQASFPVSLRHACVLYLYVFSFHEQLMSLCRCWEKPEIGGAEDEPPLRGGGRVEHSSYGC